MNLINKHFLLVAMSVLYVPSLFAASEVARDAFFYALLPMLIVGIAIKTIVIIYRAKFSYQKALNISAIMNLVSAFFVAIFGPLLINLAARLVSMFGPLSLYELAIGTTVVFIVFAAVVESGVFLYNYPSFDRKQVVAMVLFANAISISLVSYYLNIFSAVSY